MAMWDHLRALGLVEYDDQLIVTDTTSSDHAGMQHHAAQPHGKARRWQAVNRKPLRSTIIDNDLPVRKKRAAVSACGGLEF
jgi:hypothetical protein